MIKGKIIKGVGGFYYVNTENGLFECRARGVFRKENISPCVGDNVTVTIVDKDKRKGNVHEISERKNELIRPRVSNIDQSVIVFAALTPSIHLDLLDRFIILSEQQNLDILICINKIELNEKLKDEIKEIYAQSGYEVVFTSTVNNTGIEDFKNRIAGKVSVLAGPSGVGKSSLLNAVNKEFDLKTGAVSKKTKRGKHTTRYAELMEIFDDSYIVDTPGFTSLDIVHIKAESLQYYFREFAPFIDQCRFSGCSHVAEPQCAVKDNVGLHINPIRYERYKSFYQEARRDRTNG